jgi:hypothetical protein
MKRTEHTLKSPESVTVRFTCSATRHCVSARGSRYLQPSDTFWNRVLHNETAFMVQKRLQRRGLPMIVVPVRIDLRAGRPLRASAVAA